MNQPIASSGPLALDMISPLPPVRSGIADYSVDLLKALQEFAASELDVRVIRVPNQDVDVELVQAWNPTAVDRMQESQRLPVYHVGNNTYHEAIVELACERPGIVVLHDVFLHHLLQERTLAHVDVPGYVEEMFGDHGWIGGTVSLAPRWGGYSQAALFALPAHRRLLEAQRGVIVHSRWAERFLRQEGLRVPIRVVPMVMPLPVIDQAADQRASELRKSWGVPAEAFLLGSFGFQTPIKRTATALRALTHRGMESCHLVIGGATAKELDLPALSAELGLGDRVHVVGFLPREDFNAAIRACDVTVNLRYPTAGETSASLLRILALGRTSVVSDFAQFRDFSDEIVVRLPLPSDPNDDSVDGEEPRALANLLRRLVEADGSVARMGGNARRLIESEHAPKVAARAFARAVLELSVSNRLTAATTPTPPRPTSLTWGRLESHLWVEGLEDWRAGELRRLRVTLENHSFATWLAASAGPGGVMLELELVEKRNRGALHDHLRDDPWIGLPRNVQPGERSTIEIELRRPLGPTELRITPHVVGSASFPQLGGCAFTRQFS